MTDVVLDASVVIKWFKTAGERHVEEATALRGRYLAGALTVVTVSLLRLEVLNVSVAGSGGRRSVCGTWRSAWSCSASSSSSRR